MSGKKQGKDKILAVVPELSNEDIQSILLQFQSELVTRENAEKKAAIAEIRAIAERVGLIVSFADVEFTKKKTGARLGTKAKIKYRNNATGEVWSGRGLKPKWVVELIASGKNIDEYLTEAFKVPSAESEHSNSG